MKLVLGTMNFGPQLNQQESKDMLNRFLLSGNTEIDTAYVYNNGDTEEILGKILPELDPNSYYIATKVHPRITGRLNREGILLQFNESLRRLNRSSIDILYFHFPDQKTPIEEALDTVAQLYEEGKIKEFGLSNYPAWQVVDIYNKCPKHNCPLPSIYQGMYNSLCRNVEPELFPAIREMGIKFYAFNPLAGGLLTGKHEHFDDTPQPGRFERLKSYRDRYWKKTYFNAIEYIKISCDKEGIPIAEAAYRWLAFHSKLNNNDAIILGASKLEQMAQNISCLRNGVLPEHIIEAINDAWEIARPDSPSYFKFF